MAQVEIVHLSSLILPEESRLLRDHTKPEGERSEAYLQAFDRRTLVYDCVWTPDGNGRILTAPPFLNLWKPFRDGLRLDGRPLPGIRRRQLSRTDQVWLPGGKGELSVQIDGQRHEIGTRETLAASFAGSNSLMTVSKDNHPRWVRDWARFHSNLHGADAVALFDNGSTAFSLEDYAEALGNVPGLNKAVVFKAPFPFGVNLKRKRFRERGAFFFQTSMMNVARQDAFAAARAVLNVDIDELIAGPDGASIFDAAVAHPLGLVTPLGRYVYPVRPADMPCSHSAHRFVADPPRKAHRKWCVAMNSLAGRMFEWNVHQVGGLLQNWFTENNEFKLVHCWGCSTGWKEARVRSFPESIVPDPRLKAMMETYLPEPAGSEPPAAH